LKEIREKLRKRRKGFASQDWSSLDRRYRWREKSLKKSKNLKLKIDVLKELLVTNKKSNCHKIKYKKFSKYFFSAIRSSFCSAGVIDAVKMHQLL
jgi:hypothetical protein